MMKITKRIFAGFLACAFAAGFSACDKTKDEPNLDQPQGALTDIITPVVTPGAADPTVKGVMTTTEAGGLY